LRTAAAGVKVRHDFAPAVLASFDGSSLQGVRCSNTGRSSYCATRRALLRDCY
jgi:hypothetical protein